jgi:CheY-like chemotaxis protein
MQLNNLSNQLNQMSNKILCVDDDPLTLMLNKKAISKTLNSEQIHTATNGKEALLYFNEQKDHPELIFLDLNMPVMDGWEFLDYFTETMGSDIENIKIIILSSSVNPEDYKKAKTYPVVIEFLNKPITQSDLEKVKSDYLWD